MSRKGTVDGAIDRDALLAKVDALPRDPGVYIFSDVGSRIIYVGKATNLRSRVRSYFTGGDDGRPLYRYIVEQTADLDCVVTANEVEALLLENNLIKKHRPRYNVRLRDDKQYVSLRLTTAEKWPRVQVVRPWKDDGNLYFGPYSSAQSVREMLRVIKRYIPLRTCSNGFFRARTRPCMEYEIGHCTAPCMGLTTEDEYAQLVEETALFLRGKDHKLIPILEARMAKASEALEFEQAAKIRDQIRAIERVMAKQKVQEVRLGDADVFGFHRRHDFVSVQVLLIREGKILHSTTHSFRTPLGDEAVLSSFLTQFYQYERYLPPDILLPFDFEDRKTLEGWLEERRGKKLRLLVPVRGQKKELVAMASRNAEVNSSTDQLRRDAQDALARSIAAKVGASRSVRRIECYDISGMQGTLQVASRVVFEDGEPDSSLYRRYKIRTVTGTDDFKSMLEVLERRFRPGPKRDALPDLVVVDGGKGQISSAVQALERLGVDVPIVGLAKERRRGGRTVPERVFVPGRSTPIDLASDTPESLLLQRIRDEAHRFANQFHRELRRKRNLSSGLEEIPGVGARRRQALLAHFGSLRALRAASLSEIENVPGMTTKTAEATFRFLHDAEEEPPKDAPAPSALEAEALGEESAAGDEEPRTESVDDESDSNDA